MALLKTYVQAYGQLGKFFNKISEGQAPEKFTRQHLKDLGFSSSNHRALIPLLKGLGFLTSDGTPTARYMNFLDQSQSKKVLGEAVREAYADIFTLRASPKKSDKALIEGKFKSTFNTSPTVAQLCASTFLSLLDLSEFVSKAETSTKDETSIGKQNNEEKTAPDVEVITNVDENTNAKPELHYNIQIHLPPSKDIEIYNSIFKSLKEHLLD